MSSSVQISKYVNDIALIHLSDPVEWSQHVQPICLPDFEEEKFNGKQGLLAGWGFDMEGEYFLLYSFGKLNVYVSFREEQPESLIRDQDYHEINCHIIQNNSEHQ